MDIDCPLCFIPLPEKPDGRLDDGSPLPKRFKTDENLLESNICCTPCGHLFHRYCLSQWFTKASNEGTSNCPNCRKLVQQGDLYPVYIEADKRSSVKQPLPPLVLAPTLRFLPSQNKVGFEKNKEIESDSNKEKLDNLSQSLEILTKDLEDMKKKYEAEKERADVSEALVESLRVSNSNSHTSNPRNDNFRWDSFDDDGFNFFD